jgi:hypothetical protein
MSSGENPLQGLGRYRVRPESAHIATGGDHRVQRVAL